MTGKELRKIREGLDLTLIAFGRALGFAGEEDSIKSAVHRLEAGRRPIRTPLARLARMFELGSVPEGWTFKTREGRDN